MELPGCPNGSLSAASYLLSRRPHKAAFLVPDRDCVAVLKYVLPLLGYSVRVEERGGAWLVEASAVEKA